MVYQLYYYNKKIDDKRRHEVHTGACSFLPEGDNKELIGYFNNCQDAIKKAQSLSPLSSFDGCYFCCKPCHKG